MLKTEQNLLELRILMRGTDDVVKENQLLQGVVVGWVDVK